ncbi:MAG TPA: type I restriction-modification enzyme R subunit C-terminal domain-containing protein, partial [Candidatus Nitrosotalea sp.]|nr:type I restriction-modification enzyme R subunit C-terminal domain-containing protein [Candidatus Nitrosotalea sp.]
NNNQVMSYTHQKAVADGVNVGYHIFRIKTEKAEHGGKLEVNQLIEKRNRMTSKKWAEILDEEFEYSSTDLDRSIVVPDQIRKVIEAFRDNLPMIFPDREVVPKTLVFAKDDRHAEDITEIIREVFGKGNEFCKKITYKTTGDKPEDLIQSFRNSPMPRIAVSVDMIATGTDIQPLECLLFMRDVRSRIYFDQMKGRGTRKINPNDLIAVTPDATSKDHFVIVDAVGVTEHAMTDTHSMERKPGEVLKSLLDKAALGTADEDDLETLAYRLARIDKKIDPRAKDEIKKESGGLTLNDIINKLLNGIDSDLHESSAKKKFGIDEPTEAQITEVRKESIKEACKVLDAARLRSTILEVKSRSEQIIDLTPDILIFAGFGEKAIDASNDAIERFKKFLEEKKDTMIALQIIYSKPQKLKEITYNDIKELAEKIKVPPYNLTPSNLWQAYKNLEKDKVKDNPQKILADLISIIRYTLHQEDVLVPFGEKVDQKFEKWLVEQESKGRKFDNEQKDWLVMIKDQIATSITATLEDMDDIPFSEKGGRIKLHKLFGEDYQKILEELHEVLISV